MSMTGPRLDDHEKEKNEGMKPDLPMAPVQTALFKARTVLIFGEIDMKVAERVCGQLLALAAEGSGESASSSIRRLTWKSGERSLHIRSAPSVR